MREIHWTVKAFLAECKILHTSKTWTHYVSSNCHYFLHKPTQIVIDGIYGFHGFNFWIDMDSNPYAALKIRIVAVYPLDPGRAMLYQEILDFETLREQPDRSSTREQYRIAFALARTARKYNSSYDSYWYQCRQYNISEAVADRAYGNMAQQDDYDPTGRRYRQYVAKKLPRSTSDQFRWYCHWIYSGFQKA